MNGWHPGESAIREKTGFVKDPSTHFLYTSIQGDLPHDHGVFYSTRLPFLPVTVLDDDNRPWGSILADSGALGFVSYPRYTTLIARAQVWEGDPIRTAKVNQDGTSLIAGIGVEFSTRRRNKFAGKITKVDKADLWNIEINVDEAIGNCPKYIAVRELVPHPSTPKVVDSNLQFSESDRLSPTALALINESDTIFFGTAFASSDPNYPSHLGMNIRGGRPGFVRATSSGRTLVLPDYSGNRIMTSLGNVEATPLASITFASFTTGDILYITGNARNLVGEEAKKVMFHGRLTILDVTGYVYVANALPSRQKEGTEVQTSPYSPPVKFLVEERASFSRNEGDDAMLVKMKLHSDTIGTFTFSTTRRLDIVPGQAIVLDLSSFIGVPKYQHMAPGNPVSVNDDRIRTWTVSSSSPSDNEFSITLKLKPGGAATGAFFSIAHKVPAHLLDDTRPLRLSLPVMGVTGEFCLGSGTKKVVMFAGGIGVTPFLSMLGAAGGDVDVILVLSTREPEVLVPLVQAVKKEGLLIHVFSEGTFEGDVVPHAGRLSKEWLVERKAEWEGREVFVCGPAGLNGVVKGGLREAGVDVGKIREEGFIY